MHISARTFLLPAIAAALLSTTLVTSVHAQGTELEQSLAIIDFSLDKPFSKTSEYCSKVATRVMETSTNFSLLSRDDTMRLLRKELGGSSKEVPSKTIDALKGELKGLEDLIYDRPKKAIAPLGALIKKIMEQTNRYAISPKYRALVLDAYMKLARAHNDAGSSKGLKTTLSQLIRFVGDAKVTDDKYHPAVVEMWGKVKKATQGDRSATVRVTSKPSGADVLINGQATGKKTPVSIKWFPGMVFVQTKDGGQISKARKVLLTKGRTNDVKIDLEYESGVDLEGSTAGLTFTDRATFKKRAAEFAQRLGELLEVDKVALCGLTETNSKVKLEAHLVDVATAKMVRSTGLVARSNVISNNRVQGIANFIATGKVGQIQEASGGTPPMENVVGWTFIGVGVAGLALGVAYTFIFEDTLAQVECTGDYAGDTCRSQGDVSTQLLIKEAEVARALRNTGYVVGGLGIIGGIIAFVVMAPSGGSEEVAEGLNLKSIYPVVDSHTAGVGMALTF